MDKYRVREREAHRATLGIWSMAFKGLALMCWAGGVIVLLAQIVAATHMHRITNQPVMVPQGAFLGATIVITVVVVVIVFFAAGAVLWAISLILTSMAYIEENTRPEAPMPMPNAKEEAHDLKT